jgi:hypothetical protein
VEKEGKLLEVSKWKEHDLSHLWTNLFLGSTIIVLSS